MTLLLIDVSHLFWSSWHASADREIGAAFQWTIERVASLKNGHKHTAICCDFPPYFRREISPDYKAQREAQPPAASEQFRRTRERLEKDGHVIWQARGFEADDVIAGAVAWARSREEPLEVTIASADKDLLQLVAEGVRVLSTRTNEYMGADEVMAKFGVYPEQMRDLLALAGDKSDNVPGVPGVGPKKAADLLKRFGSLAGIVSGLDSIEQPKLRETLREHLINIELSRKLVTLRTDAPIDYETLFAPREVRHLTDFSDADFEDVDTDEPEDDVGAAEQQKEPEATQESEAAAEAPRAKAITGNGGGTAIVLAPPSFELELQPRSIKGAFDLAKGIYESRLYSKFTSPEAICAVIIRGREMGLGALTALDCFHVVEGKPALHAHLIIARAKQHPDCEYFQMVESTGARAVYETKNRRNKNPTRHTYTLEQAKQAGVCPEHMRTKREGGDKDRRTNWEKRPAEMLAKTCGVQLARMEYPDAALGLYAIEELEET